MFCLIGGIERFESTAYTIKAVVTILHNDIQQIREVF